MIYALVIVCGLSGAPCTTIEDRAGPYGTREERHARHETIRPYVREIIAPTFANSIGQPARVVEVCDTLERIRQHLPGAFAGERAEVAI